MRLFQSLIGNVQPQYFCDFYSLISFQIPIFCKFSPKKEESKISEVIKEGNWIKHKIYGKGKIVKVEKTSLMVDFRMVGKKKIGMEWCLKNCEVLK